MAFWIRRVGARAMSGLPLTAGILVIIRCLAAELAGEDFRITH
jgi:hypothetical protein